MPNAANVDRPITIVSYGRSGTSLLSGLLSAHPKADFVGETAPMVSLTWLAAERSIGIVRRNLHHPREVVVPDNEFCASAVQGAFLKLFPSDAPFWIQKPIGIPPTFWLMPGTIEEKARWYWNVFKQSFSQGQYLTILRDPFEVTISAHNYWKFPIPKIVEQLAEMATIITHRDSLIKRAISYDDVVKNPEHVMRDLCKFLDIGYVDAMMVATQKRHVRSSSASSGAKSVLYKQIKDTPNFESCFQAVADMWKSFGVQPQWWSDR